MRRRMMYYQSVQCCPDCKDANNFMRLACNTCNGVGRIVTTGKRAKSSKLDVGEENPNNDLIIAAVILFGAAILILSYAFLSSSVSL